MASEQQYQTDTITSSPAKDSSPNSAQPPEPRRQSSVRFSEDTNTSSRSAAMSNRRHESPDEITPIRSTGETTTRNYETTGRRGRNQQQPDGAAVESPPKPKPTPSSNRNTQEEEEHKDQASWYKRVADKFGSVTLENKGSVARDHLALERTFLAWLRTSLAFASIGVAITQLFRLNTTIASRTKQYSASSINRQHDLPFSPLLGQSIPLDLLPYLAQQAVSSATTAIPSLGPTLLDQLLRQPATPSDLVSIKAFDEEAAAKLRHVGKPLGATFLGISIVILIIGFHRYFESQYWIVRGKFPASRGSIFLVGFIAGALILASLLVVLLVAPTSYEK